MPLLEDPPPAPPDPATPVPVDVAPGLPPPWPDEGSGSESHPTLMLTRPTNTTQMPSRPIAYLHLIIRRNAYSTLGPVRSRSMVSPKRFLLSKKIAFSSESARADKISLL